MQHISQMLRPYLCGQVLCRPRIETLPRFIGEHQQRVRILKNKIQTVLRERRVERHISRAGFENPQQPGQHVHAARHANADQDIGPGAALHQPMRHLIGTRIQLGIRHGEPARFDRDLVRRQCRLALDQFMQTQVAAVIARGSIPLEQHLLTLSHAQQRKLRNTRLRVTHHPGQQVCVMLQQARRCRRFEQRGVIFQRRSQPGA